MSIWTLGSINIDHVYRLPHLPAPGETLAASGYTCGLGGKGANQSIAAARAQATVFHIGAVGRDDSFARTELAASGVDVRHVATVDAPTGHAIINVDDAGENAIVILGGANSCQSADAIAAAMGSAVRGDFLMLQNETNAQLTAATLARDRGVTVVYSAAPFAPDAVHKILPMTDLLLVNEGEAARICDMLGCALAEIPVPRLLVTRGAKGATLYQRGAERVDQAAIPVTPVDTTGAGDTFAGYFVAALDRGETARQSLAQAAAAAALQVTRPGAASAIPDLSEVLDLLRRTGGQGADDAVRPR